MASVTFLLKEPNSDKPSLIYMIFRNLGDKLKVSTKQRVLTKYWDFEKRRLIDSKKVPGYLELNMILDNMENRMMDIYRRLLNDNQEISMELLRKIFVGNEEAKTEILLVDYIKDYIKNVKTIYRKNTPYPIKERTKQKYQSTLNKLIDYEVKFKKKLTFNDIDIKFHLSFIQFLRENYTREIDEEEIGMGENTVGKHIKVLKTFLNNATEDGINKKLVFRHKKFTAPSEVTEKIYLNTQDLSKLYRLDLSEKKRLEKVRDLFLIGCFTAFRYSDLSGLSKNDIYDNDIGKSIKIKTVKTFDNAVLPVHRVVKEILDRYEGQLPPSMTNQKMNVYLKELGEEAKIDNPVKVTYLKGGKRITKVFKKYELITTHTARRTFATNLYLGGTPLHIIIQYTQHKDIATLMDYIGAEAEEAANRLTESDYFKNLKL